MEGSKQCPACECTDVPVNAEICPFCGHSFGKQPIAEPAGAGKRPGAKRAGGQNMPEAKPAEEERLPEMPESHTETWEEHAKSMMEAGERLPVPGGAAAPASTEYKTYQKKGRRKQTDSNTSKQEQGRKMGISGWLAALAMATLCMGHICMYQIVLRGGWGSIVCGLVLTGTIAGAMHYCCFADVKGSRKAGALGIIVGNIAIFYFIFSGSGSIGMQISYVIPYIFKRYYGSSVLAQIVAYTVCWFTAAKLAKNRKSILVFCLTAAEVVLLPYFVNWLLIRSDGGRMQMLWWSVAIPCAAMLLAEFLLYCIQRWLARKSRWLFWVLYMVIVIWALVSIHNCIIRYF